MRLLDNGNAPDARQPECDQCLDHQPTEIDLEAPHGEFHRTWKGMVIVVQFFAAYPDCQGRHSGVKLGTFP
jgi:hypothetical protein